MQAKISTGRSFWWRYTYTDDNGHFRATKRYRGKVRIRAKWRGYTATIRKSWNEVLGIQVSDHLMTLKRSNNHRIKRIRYTHPHDGIFGLDLRGGHLWIKGSTHNGLRRYIDFCEAQGIDRTISRANVWAWARGGASSNPMFKKMPDVFVYAALTNGSQSTVWNQLVNTGAYLGIAIVPRWLRPDQIYQGLGSKTEEGGDGRSNTVRIHQLVFHESGHYSHAIKAGSVFWGNAVGATINNSIAHDDPYHTGTAPTLQKGSQIALVEGWATFTEYKITTFYYEKAYYDPLGQPRAFYDDVVPGGGISIERFMENFSVYDRPMTAPRFDDDSWFFHGILWDLLDDGTEIQIGTTGQTFSRRRDGAGLALNNIVDNINIGDDDRFNLSFIFDALTSNVYNECDLRQSIINNIPGLDGPINELFNSYGYFCNQQP